MNNFPIHKIPYFLILIFLQIFIFLNNPLFGIAFCFVYVACILMWPIDANISALMTFSFFIGLVIDMFSNTLGVHTSASVFTAYTRTFWIKYLTPTGGYDKSNEISLKSLGRLWIINYLTINTLIHICLLYIIENLEIVHWGWFILKTLSSTLFTCLMIYVIEVLANN